jgi:hypothetical protein
VDVRKDFADLCSLLNEQSVEFMADLRQTVRGSLWLIRRPENASHVSCGVKNSNDLQRLGFAPIDDQIRIGQ